MSSPPSSYPTYPGGAPIRRDKEKRSVYSDISIFTSELELGKRFFARHFANSVFPTPVGPKKRNTPMGRFGFFNPVLDLLIALTMLLMASFCPTI